MGASDYLEGKILDDIFGIAAFSVPATVYIALYTAAPSDTGGGTECSGNAYARVAVTNTAASWSRVGNQVTNDNAITFPSPTGAAWGTVTHWGMFDAASAGNLLMWGALTTSRATAAGTAPNFPAGDLQTNLD